MSLHPYNEMEHEHEDALFDDITSMLEQARGKAVQVDIRLTLG